MMDFRIEDHAHLWFRFVPFVPPLGLLEDVQRARHNECQYTMEELRRHWDLLQWYLNIRVWFGDEKGTIFRPPTLVSYDMYLRLIVHQRYYRSVCRALGARVLLRFSPAKLLPGGTLRTAFAIQLLRFCVEHEAPFAKTDAPCDLFAQHSRKRKRSDDENESEKGEPKRPRQSRRPARFDD